MDYRDMALILKTKRIASSRCDQKKVFGFDWGGEEVEQDELIVTFHVKNRVRF